MNRSYITALCLAMVLFGWGISWELLPLQTSGPDLPRATVPVFYRFLFAGSLFTLFIIARDVWRGQITFAFPPHIWGLVALKGVGFFSLNYSLFYFGQQALPPGIVALFFSFVVITNLGMTMVFTGRPPRRSTAFAAFIGFMGLVGVLSPSIWADGGIELDVLTLRHAGVCLLGTMVVSLATRVQVRLNTLGVPVVTSTAFAMLFGTTYVGLFSLWQGFSFDISAAPTSFYWALALLVVFGSIGGFSAYLKLVGLIGPNRGAYVNLGTAVVALIISYFAGTGDDLTVGQFGGIALILLGCYLILRDKTPAPS